MKNFIYVIVIFFWILSLISKSKKQKQQTAERERIKQMNKRIGQRPEAEPLKRKSSEDIRALFADRQSQTPPTNYEQAYASGDYREETKTEALESEDEHEPVSHFKKNYGMTASLGTESSEEKEAYDKDQTIIAKLSLDNASIKQYVIASEILGKPKALRR
jgi:hypothetical protein